MSDIDICRAEECEIGTPQGASELKVMLGGTDATFAAALLRLLKENPWPSSDPAWEAIEIWAKDILRRLNVQPNK